MRATEAVEAKKITILKGQKGDTGEAGIMGRKPLLGVDFKKPKDGKRGKAGREGKSGREGARGERAETNSLDTAEELVSKLNTQKSSLNSSVVAGLDQTLEEIKKAIRGVSASTKGKGGGGGGMGNITHQTFSGNGSTTEFTLNSKVAAGGNAIWAYYQGQFLVLGTGYTLSEKTLTALFTPENGTFIDVVYVRT